MGQAHGNPHGRPRLGATAVDNMPVSGDSLSAASGITFDQAGAYFLPRQIARRRLAGPLVVFGVTYTVVPAEDPTNRNVLELMPNRGA